jgi:mannitol-1-phosphate 5-dehydrogenase
MTKPSIVIWGAGRIGRGFVADLFHSGGYHCILVDQSQALIDELRAAGRFTVVRARGEDQCEEQVIEGCTALHTSETQAIAAAIQHCDLLALAIFPRLFRMSLTNLPRIYCSAPQPDPKRRWICCFAPT